MNAILYQTTCLINGKIYIGVDGKCDRDYLGSGKALNNAIRKYGRENFRRKDLAAFDSKREAFEAEKEIVTPEWCESTDNYNIDGGGRGPSYISEATRAKLRRRRLLQPPPSKETCAKISKGKMGNKSRLGQPHTKATKRKMAQASKRPFMLGGVRHETVKDAAVYFGISVSSIIRTKKAIREGLPLPDVAVSVGIGERANLV